MNTIENKCRNDTEFSESVSYIFEFETFNLYFQTTMVIKVITLTLQMAGGALNAIGEYSAKKNIFSMVGKKGFLYFSLLVVQIFIFLGEKFQD